MTQATHLKPRRNAKNSHAVEDENLPLAIAYKTKSSVSKTTKTVILSFNSSIERQIHW
jgi:hypothetical protein